MPQRRYHHLHNTAQSKDNMQCSSDKCLRTGVARRAHKEVCHEQALRCDRRQASGMTTQTSRGLPNWMRLLHNTIGQRLCRQWVQQAHLKALERCPVCSKSAGVVLKRPGDKQRALSAIRCQTNRQQTHTRTSTAPRTLSAANAASDRKLVASVRATSTGSTFIVFSPNFAYEIAPKHTRSDEAPA